MVVGFSIVVPTIGRNSLTEVCLPSILGQVTELDQVVVVHDGHDIDMEPAYQLLADAVCDWDLVRIDQRGGYGHPARNFAIEHVVDRPRLLTIDDDDCYLPGAFATVRAAVAACPPAVHVFGAKWGPGHPAHGTVLPRGRGLLYGEIATPMIVAPVCTARFGAHYAGDWEYALDLAKVFGEDGFVWHPESVIAEVRPEVAYA